METSIGRIFSHGGKVSREGWTLFSVEVTMLCRFNSIAQSLSDSDRQKLQRSMGLKMEQLKVRQILQPPLYSSLS